MASLIVGFMMDRSTLPRLFERAADFAASGQYREAKDAYERAATGARSADSPLQSSELQQFLRSVDFSLAQVLNRLKDFQGALAAVDEGLSLSPTDLGRAIGLSAKGEALCSLSHPAEGLAAFAETVLAHPVAGRLNAADSMTGMGAEERVGRAEQWVEDVENSFGWQLSTQGKREVLTTRGKIAGKRRDYSAARRQFEVALLV
ncbi:MAG: hypothetical protein JSU00_25755 [Acidobacteria bacterium]|nr:hypothetical protein [Acidobacteriota bacterium]